MKLIKMTDFVLERNNLLKKAPDAYDQYWKIVEYARFLKQPLTLGMFVPCDDDGNVLTEPNFYYSDKDLQRFKSIELSIALIVNEKVKIYREAQSKVIFNDCALIKQGNHYIIYYKNDPIWGTWNDSKTIEGLIPLNIDFASSF